MFSRCCGDRQKKKVVRQCMVDAETQVERQIKENNDIAVQVIAEDEVKIVAEPQPEAIVTQPKVSEDVEDDEVFEEGVGPPVKLAKNMGRPSLPKWFSEENCEDEEVGGVQEPPATPIGRDELALRRHRFFSELVSAAAKASEHKVHFDPLGPDVVPISDVTNVQSFEELDQLVARLESVTVRLESVCQPVQEILGLANCVASDEEEPNTTKTMSVFGYEDIVRGPLAQYLSVSQQIGGDVAQHASLVRSAFETQLQYIVLASQSKQPSAGEIANLIQPTAKCIQGIQEFREKNRGSQFFNHLSAISESVPALGWVAVSPTPAPYVKEMNDAGQFYTNRVLKDWKEKDKKHVDWVRAWVQTLTDLQTYVKQHHTTGLVWSGRNAVASSGAMSMPPPPPAPPLSAMMCDLSMTADADNDRSALFAEINRGSDVTKGLKKVTSDMQTHKNPSLRTGPAPFKAPAYGACGGGPVAPVDKPPVFRQEGKKWLIEYQKGNHQLVVDGAEMNNVVYVFRCSDSTVVVKGKVNSITFDSCKKTSVVFDSLVSAMEFINCQSVQMQVMHKVPTISIDKTDGCQMFLSKESLDVEIVSSKSSEMNVLVPKGDGDYVEHPIPEQYKTTIGSSGLKTIIIENKG